MSDAVDLYKYYTKEVASDLEKNLVGKIILSRQIKVGLKKAKDFIATLQANMYLDDTIGLDWFDYGFATKRSGKFSISFYKVVSGKKQIAEITFESGDNKEILSTIKSVKESMKGKWW